MACSDYDELWKFFADFSGQHPVDGIVCAFTETTGMALFALVVFGGAGLAMTVRTESLAPAIVANMFAASVIFVFVPAPAARIGAALMLFGLTIAGYIIYQRSSSAL